MSALNAERSATRRVKVRVMRSKMMAMAASHAIDIAEMARMYTGKSPTVRDSSLPTENDKICGIAVAGTEVSGNGLMLVSTDHSRHTV